MIGSAAQAFTILGLDFGARRIGVALADTISRSPRPLGIVEQRASGPDWQQLDRLIANHAPRLLVLGRPYNDDGTPGRLAGASDRFGRSLQERYTLSVARVDEGHSSREATAELVEQRRSGTRRTRIGHADIDAQAAAVILQRWLTVEKGEQRMSDQRRPDGSLRHLMTLDGLRRGELESLLQQAQRYVCAPGAQPISHRSLTGITIGNLFTEPSTRTRVSFELAGRRLGADVVNLEVQLSSRAKGESMLDTVRTLESLHFDVFVIRDSQAGVVAHVADNVLSHVSVLSAGEAHVSHPTQGLLDALTVQQSKGERFDRLRVAIVGDIKHSRVARSAYEAFTGLGVGELRLIAPDGLMPASGEFPQGMRFATPEAGLPGADVVMMLRIQKERMESAAIPDGDWYFQHFGLTPQRLKLARQDAIVMHPQPMNRGIEIESSVADGPQSVIRQQVSNGVAVRMAVLETVTRPRALRS